MTHYVVLMEIGHTFITEHAPDENEPLIKRVVPCDNIGHALAVQALAIDAKNTVVTDIIQNYRREDIEEHKKVIAAKNERIAMAENECAIERTRTRDREIVLHNVMNALALDMALERTHQQRNAAMRHIVRIIKAILDNVVTDMDDIPF